MEIKDKTVIVTGAGRGIGRAISCAFAERGGHMVLIARSERELWETQREIRAQGGKAISIVCDIRSRNAVDGMVQEVIRQYRHVDILVNNAGVFIPSSVLECSDEIWEETLETNLTGLFYCTRAVLPGMLQRESGQIINMVSGAGVHAFPGAAAYCASKFGVMGFSESLLEEVRGRRIKVSVILPGMVQTGMVKDDRYAHVRKIPPEDVAQTVLYAAMAKENTLISRVEVRHIMPRE